MTGTGFFRRLRSLLQALLALAYYILATALASRAASGLSSGTLSLSAPNSGALNSGALNSGAWFEFVRGAVLLFLLIIGYAAAAILFQRERRPLASMGLVFRPCWHREFGLGAALGWGMMVACILPIALGGGLVVAYWNTPRQFGFLAINFVTLAILTLVQEVVFRGYFFQRLIAALGTTLATILVLIVTAVLHARDTDWTALSMTVALLIALLLCLAYLRTRALWLGWGFHFAWTATMAMLFGLPDKGSSHWASVVESDASGPYKLTGGGYGPEAGLLAVIALIAGITLLIRLTRQYAWQYAQPVIVAGGMPVDLDSAQQRQHESASVDPGLNGPATNGAPRLVQIAPVTSTSPVAFGPVSLGPVSLGPVSLGPVSGAPVSAIPANPPPTPQDPQQDPKTK